MKLQAEAASANRCEQMELWTNGVFFLGWTFWIKTKIVTKLDQEEVKQLIYDLKKKCTILMITFLVLLLRLFAVVLVTSLPGEL